MEDHSGVTAGAILAAARVRRQQESGRHDGSEVGLEGGSTDIEEYGCGERHKYAGTETVNAQVGG